MIYGTQRVSYLLEVLVTVNVLLVMGVLQLVGLDVLPEGLDDAGAGLSVNAKQASQARVQLKLGRLWKRRNRITTLFFLLFFLQPPTSEPLHQTLLSFVPLPHLVVQHQQQSASHAHVSRPFHLEAVGLLGGGRAVPLKQQIGTH